MLQTIQAEQELTPMAFSLSMHNAISDLFHIALKVIKEITIIATGLERITLDFIVALGLLYEAENEVLIILFDKPIADLNSLFIVFLLLDSLWGKRHGINFCHSKQTRDDGEHPVQLNAFAKFF
jgi:hypothetical protein